jgi:hypothetical protein
MGNGLMSDGEISVLMPAMLLPLDRETSSTTNQIILIDFLCSLARFCCQSSETLAIRIDKCLSLYFKLLFLIDSTRERCHPRNTKLSKK